MILDIEQVASFPCPVFAVTLPDKATEWSALSSRSWSIELYLRERGIRGLWHAASFDGLGAVASTGIEVTPTDATIYASDSLGKVLEYGGPEKLVLVFDPPALDRTYREVSADSPPAEIEALKVLFPFAMPSEDGAILWLTRLPEDDPRRATPYEWNYARWIPGDPFDALQAIVVVGTNSIDLRERTRAVLGACESPTWS